MRVRSRASGNRRQMFPKHRFQFFTCLTQNDFHVPRQRLVLQELSYEFAHKCFAQMRDVGVGQNHNGDQCADRFARLL